MDRELGTIETAGGSKLIRKDSGWYGIETWTNRLVTLKFGVAVPQDYLPDAVERQLHEVADFIGGTVLTVNVPAIPQVGDVVC